MILLFQLTFAIARRMALLSESAYADHDDDRSKPVILERVSRIVDRVSETACDAEILGRYEHHQATPCGRTGQNVLSAGWTTTCAITCQGAHQVGDRDQLGSIREIPLTVEKMIGQIEAGDQNTIAPSQVAKAITAIGIHESGLIMRRSWRAHS